VSLGQLGFFAYNMVKFEVAGDSVRALLHKYSRFATGSSASGAEWAALLAQVDKFLEDRDGPAAAVTGGAGSPGAVPAAAAPGPGTGALGAAASPGSRGAV
jgi:hypothetical protein